MSVSHDSEAPAQGQQVITACAFIHQVIDGKEKLFLAKRAAAKKFLPNVWEMPGGHVDFGEDIISGLQRELLEELGMTITIGDPFAVFTYMNNIKGSHSVEVIYFAKFNGPIENIKLDQEDHSEYGWFAEDELGNIIDNRSAEDPEIANIKKRFALLRGESLKF